MDCDRRRESSVTIPSGRVHGRDFCGGHGAGVFGGGIDHEHLAQPKPELRGAAGAADLEERPDQERNSDDEECGEENHGASFLAVLRPACPTTTRGRFPCREDRLGEDQAAITISIHARRVCAKSKPGSA